MFYLSSVHAAPTQHDVWAAHAIWSNFGFLKDKNSNFLPPTLPNCLSLASKHSGWTTCSIVRGKASVWRRQPVRTALSSVPLPRSRRQTSRTSLSWRRLLLCSKQQRTPPESPTTEAGSSLRCDLSEQLQQLPHSKLRKLLRYIRVQYMPTPASANPANLMQKGVWCVLYAGAVFATWEQRTMKQNRDLAPKDNILSSCITWGGGIVSGGWAAHQWGGGVSVGVGGVISLGGGNILTCDLTKNGRGWQAGGGVIWAKVLSLPKHHLLEYYFAPVWKRKVTCPGICSEHICDVRTTNQTNLDQSPCRV